MYQNAEIYKEMFLNGLIIDNIAESRKSSCKRMLSQFLIADPLNACMRLLSYEDNVDYCS